MAPLSWKSGGDALIERAFAVSICGLFLGTVLFMTWISDRGFDITDEGLYLLSARYPSEVKLGLGAAHIYGGFLFRAVGYDVQLFRLSGLTLIVCAAAALGIGLRKVLARLLDARVMLPSVSAVISFVGLGAILYCSWLPPTPSYNLFVAFGVTAATGAVLGALAQAGDGMRAGLVRQWTLFVAGALLALVFFVKFSAGIAVGFLHAALLLVWPGRMWRQCVSNVIALATGFVAWCIFHFAMIQSADVWISMMRDSFAQIALLQSHGPFLILAYPRQIALMLLSALWHFWPFFALVAIVYGVTRQKKSSPADGKRLIRTAFVVASLLLIPYGYWKGLHLGGMNSYGRAIVVYVVCFFLIMLIFVMRCLSGERTGGRAGEGLKFLLLCAVLAVLPFASAVGTGNTLPGNAILTMAPGFALLFLAGLWSTKDGSGRTAFHTLMLVVGIFAATQVISGNVADPYRLNAGILEQAVPTEIGDPPTRVKLDPDTSAFLRSMRATVTRYGLKAGDDVLGLVRLPGVVFALGAKSPGIPWYTSGYPGARAYNEAGLSSVSKERLKRAFVLESVTTPEAMPDLEKFGLKFPREYDQLGEAVWPLTKVTVRIWKTKSRS